MNRGDGMTEAQRAIRITAIQERLIQMRSSMAGCDWCCGGGDEEWDALVDELQRLGGEFPAPVQPIPSVV
jgi:hypothetical protein